MPGGILQALDGNLGDTVGIIREDGTVERAVLVSPSAVGGVTSWNLRVGPVVPIANDYTSSQVANASGVAGAEVTDALNTLNTGKVSTTRTISTTAPLAGGGDLSADRTLSVATVSNTSSGVVPQTNGTAGQLLTASAGAAAPTWTTLTALQVPGVQHANGNLTGAVNVDTSLGNSQTMTLTGNATVTLTNLPASPQWYQLTVTQGSGGQTLTIASAKTPGGSGLTLSTGSGNVDIVSVFWDGAQLYATVAGLAFA